MKQKHMSLEQRKLRRQQRINADPTKKQIERQIEAAKHQGAAVFVSKSTDPNYKYILNIVPGHRSIKFYIWETAQFGLAITFEDKESFEMWGGNYEELTGLDDNQLGEKFANLYQLTTGNEF